MNYTFGPQSEVAWLIHEQTVSVADECRRWFGFFVLNLMTWFHADDMATRPDPPPHHTRPQ